MWIVLISLLLSFALTTLAYSVWERHAASAKIDKVRRRLGPETEAERVGRTGAPLLIRTGEPRQPRWFGSDRLQLMMEAAGRSSTPVQVQKQCAVAAFVGGAVGLAGAQWWTVWVAIPAALIGGTMPLLFLRRAGRKRLALFESQFPGALEFIARSMRAGHAFSVSLEMLHRECEQPLAGEFRRVFEEQNLGMPLDTALTRLASRIQMVDVQFFVSAVILQRKTGGNLTEILDTLAEVIRERYKLKGKVKAISAHGRMTAQALSAIPVIVGAMMFVVNKEYSIFFFHTQTGAEMLVGSAVLQIVAYLVIRKIVNIEV